MTFVENAFKHVSKHIDKPNWIIIKLNIEEQFLDLSVSNSTSSDAVSGNIGYSGIGLKIVQRRLDLIYPEKYELDVQQRGSSFDIKLQVCLYELVNPLLIPNTLLIYK